MTFKTLHAKVIRMGSMGHPYHPKDRQSGETGCSMQMHRGGKAQGYRQESWPKSCSGWPMPGGPHRQVRPASTQLTQHLSGVLSACGGPPAPLLHGSLCPGTVRADPDPRPHMLPSQQLLASGDILQDGPWEHHHVSDRETEAYGGVGAHSLSHEMRGRDGVRPQHLTPGFPDVR